MKLKLPDLLVDARAGENVRDVSQITLEARNYFTNVVGFVFNGVIVRITDELTPNELVVKYYAQIATKEE